MSNAFSKALDLQFDVYVSLDTLEDELSIGTEFFDQLIKANQLGPGRLKSLRFLDHCRKKLTAGLSCEPEVGLKKVYLVWCLIS